MRSFRLACAALAAIVVVPALAADQPAARAAGIFLTTATASGAVRLHGQMLQRMRQTGMLKTMLTGGFGKSDVVGELGGSRAAVRAPSGSPSFELRLAGDTASSPSAGMGMADLLSAVSGDMMPPQARSADEFALIRLHVKGDSREAHVGTVGGRSGQSGKSRDAVPFRSEAEGAGVFRVTPSQPLAPGEYAFYFAARGPGGQLWDFGVDTN